MPNNGNSSLMPEFVLRGHVWLTATLIPLLADVLTLKALLALLTPSGRLRPYRGYSADRIAEIVRRRLRNPRNMRRRACFRRGLTLFHFLHLAGIPAVLHFGAYAPPQPPGRMHAHCWITVQGKPMTDAPGAHAAVVLTHTGTHVPQR